MEVIIEVKNLSISFKEKKVLKGVNFCLEKGECLGLIGGSGEGKSTILRSIIGLEHPNEGEVLFNGNSILNLEQNEYVSIRKKISYVFQGGALFDSMTVYENLAFPLREHTDWSEKKIKLTVLHELKEFELDGCEDMLPAALSGGMQKRMGIARAIILKPVVVLYDEPTSGLDPYKKRNMQNTIMRLQKRGTSSVIVTHDMQTALRICDRIALLSGGRIKAIGTPDNLKKNHDVILNNFIKGIKKGEDNGKKKKKHKA